MSIHVFETTVSVKDFKKYRKTFELLWEDLRWNFDFEDNQNILKIVSLKEGESVAGRIQKTMSKLGFKCVEIY